MCALVLISIFNCPYAFNVTYIYLAYSDSVDKNGPIPEQDL